MSVTLVSAVIKVTTAHLSGGKGYARAYVAFAGGGSATFLYEPAAYSTRTDTYSIPSPTIDIVRHMTIWLSDFDTNNGDYGGVFGGVLNPATDPCQLLIYDVVVELTNSDGAVFNIRPLNWQRNDDAIGDGSSILGGAGGIFPEPIINPGFAIDSDPTTYCTIWRTVFRSLADYDVNSLVLSGFSIPLALLPAWLIIDEPSVSNSIQTVPGTTLPWVSGGGLNSGYNYTQTGGTSPVVIACAAGTAVQLQYLGGTASIGSGNPSTDCNGLSLITGPGASGTAGQYFTGRPLYVGGLIGAFTDGTGAIVSLVNIGNNGTFITPSGATQLQIGMDDGVFGDNTGSWSVLVTVVTPGGRGLTDRTNYLARRQGVQHKWTLQRRQRGQATVELWIPAGDSYLPTRSTPLYLWDQTSVAWTLDWSGLIQDIEQKWIGFSGNRRVTLTCVSFESIFDTVYVSTPKQYVNKTCGYIFADLFSSFEIGCQLTLGTVADGPTLPLFNAQMGDKLSDLFGQLATTLLGTWGVNPQLSQVYLQTPSSMPAPYTLANLQVNAPGGDLSIQWKVNGADFRSRQAVKVSPTAIGPAMEFFTGSGQQAITLRNAVAQITKAYATLSTCNTATGSFSGVPSPGDTVTIGPAAGTRVPSHIYALGGIIIVNGYVQQVTFAGTSASGAGPTFSIVTGGTTTDGSVIWTCMGPSGLATGTDTYTWVSALDNAQWGQVLIGATAAACCQNLVDAINATIAQRTVTISLPTWECNQCNAIYTSGTSFTLQQKAAGSGWVSAISATGTAFAWSASFTTGGTSPQGSLGPNEGATIELQAYEQGTSTAAPGVAYVKGSNVITLATPLNPGSNLNISYIRADAGVIEVENTALVAMQAMLTHGTGKNQRIYDASSQGLISNTAAGALQLAQQALAAYSVPPNSFEVTTFQPGFLPGQTMPVALTRPSAALGVLNGEWFIEEITAEFLHVKPWFGMWGHYRYTVKMVDLSEIGSYLDYWNGLGGGGGSGGGAGGSPLVATSGGALAPTNYQINFADDETPSGTINGSNVTFTLANAPSPGKSLALFLNGVLQDQGVDYTISGSTITFTSAPSTNAQLIAFYRY